MINPEHEHLAALLEQLAEPDVERRSQAAQALAALRDLHAVEPLIAALHDGNEYVRANVAWALGQLRDKRAFDSLLLAIRDGRVNTTGIEALGLIDPYRAVEPLLQQLQAADWGIRWHAARCATRRISRLVARVFAIDTAAAKSRSFLYPMLSISPLAEVPVRSQSRPCSLKAALAG